MTSLDVNLDKIEVRLAQSPEEVEEAQAVRFQVFYEEHGATPAPEVKKLGRDFDVYDPHSDHLIVIDRCEGHPKIVGTYRLLRASAAAQCGGFYSAQEYDIAPLLNSGQELLELGRSCVLKEYRMRPVLQMLWQGIADYITDHKVDLMFGCASFHETDIEKLREPLSYMYHYHLAPESMQPRALAERYIDMNLLPKENLDERRVFAGLPPLVKGYLRLGATIGSGAVLDEDFKTTDVMVMVKTDALTGRYRKHYERKIQKTIHGALVQTGKTDD